MHNPKLPNMQTVLLPTVEADLNPSLILVSPVSTILHLHHHFTANLTTIS